MSRLIQARRAEPAPPHAELVTVTWTEPGYEPPFTITLLLVEFDGCTFLTLANIDRSTITLTDENRIRFPDGSIDGSMDDALIDRLAARRVLAAPRVGVLVCTRSDDEGVIIDTTCIRGYAVLGALDWQDATVEYIMLTHREYGPHVRRLPDDALTPALRGAMAGFLVQRVYETRAARIAAQPVPVVLAYGGTEDTRAAFCVACAAIAPQRRVATCATLAAARAEAARVREDGDNIVMALFNLDAYADVDADELASLALGT